MINEQILKLAAEAGISDWFLGTQDFQSGLQAKRIEQLKRFAELVLEERELFGVWEDGIFKGSGQL